MELGNAHPSISTSRIHIIYLEFPPEEGLYNFRVGVIEKEAAEFFFSSREIRRKKFDALFFDRTSIMEVVP